MLRHALALTLLVTPGLAIADDDVDAGAGGRSAFTIPVAREAAFPGTMLLNIDATDIDRAIFRVTQTIPVPQSGTMTLLLPKWLPGNHAPRGEVEKFTGLTIKAGGRTLLWKRDPVDVYAFHVTVPAGTRALEASFQFVSATEADQGRIVMTQEMMNLQWNNMSLYPAGYYTSAIPVTATVKYPAGWKAATAVRPVRTDGDTITYETVPYDTLVDSPVFAGKYFRSEPLGESITLNIVADAPKYLVIKPYQLEAHKRLVSQAVKLFGTRQYDRYEFLLSLTDRMGGIGLEHHRSSENGVNPEYFTEWESGPGRRNLLPHELVHSWNGKHRRPAGQIVPDYRTPLIDDLLWVYEGQTQFWGYVLGARSGLFSKQETLDALANIAANLDIRRGRDWRSLDDTTYDPIITPRRPKGWVSWQRSEDYYNEGMLIWLESDAIIRERSKGAKSLDDFARLFFGTKDGDYSAKPYDFKELVRTLGSVQAFDWDGFLTRRLTEKASGAPLTGLTMGGYRLTYGDTPTAFFVDSERRAKELNLSFSLGGTIGKNKLTSVVWDGPLFNAGLVVGTEIIAVNGHAYGDEEMREAIINAKASSTPVRLIVKNGDRVREVAIPYYGGPRYPRLERTGTAEGSLDLLLKPR